MQIGFVGLGTMGTRMAGHLQKAGYKLVVHDLRRDAAAPHLAIGAVWADTPRAVAQQSDVILRFRIPSTAFWRKPARKRV